MDTYNAPMNNYRFTASPSMVERSDGAHIPWDEVDNCPLDTHGLSYKIWIANGSPIPEPYVEPPAPVPERVSMFQAREAMRLTPYGAGTLLDAVNAYVASNATANPRLVLAWEYATEIERHGVFVTSLAAQFGLDDVTLDGLFKLASGIKA